MKQSQKFSCCAWHGSYSKATGAGFYPKGFSNSFYLCFLCLQLFTEHLHPMSYLASHSPHSLHIPLLLCNFYGFCWWGPPSFYHSQVSWHCLLSLHHVCGCLSPPAARTSVMALWAVSSSVAIISYLVFLMPLVAFLFAVIKYQTKAT